MKKLVGVVLVVAMLVGCMTGCGGSAKKKAYDPDNFMTAQEAEESGNPYQIVKEKITLRVFVPRGSSNPEYSSMRMFQVLSKLTNIEFEFVEAAVDQYMTLRSVAWEDKENLPDLFLYNNTISEIVIYSEQGALTPFNDASYEKNGVKIGSLIDNYMPTYKALLEKNFDLEDRDANSILTIRDGLMYSSAAVNDVPRDLTFKYYINQKWIDNINEYFIGDQKLPNAKDITTVEQYLEVLRAFKKYDANLNDDPNDEIPVTAESLEYIRNLILSAYGYVSAGVEIENDGSAFTYVPSTEAYKKYLETMTTMYEEGLLDNTTFSTNSTMIASKGFANRLGSFSRSAAYITVGDELDADYTTFGPLTSAEYTDTPVAYSYATINPLGAVIPANTQYAREIARLLDIMYSEIGVSLNAFGEEGTDWKWTDNSKTAWEKTIPESFEGSDEEYRKDLSPNVGLGVGLYISYDFIGKEATGYTTYLNQLSERYEPYLKEPIPAEVHLTSEDYNTESLIGTTLSNYVKESEFQFVTGELSIDKDWSSYLSKLEEHRYKELLQLYNDALNASRD